MKLFATPKSHFSRKIRLLLDHMEKPYALVDIGNVADNAPAVFSDNPIMAVPVLEDGDVWMIESDHIAAYIVRTYQPKDPYEVLTTSVTALNARAVMNGIMGNEVKVILADRTGLDPKPHAYFQKALKAMTQSLNWLEERAPLFANEALTYLDFQFISMWDHLKLYGVVPLDYPQLAAVAQRLSDNKMINQSKPF